MKYIRTIIGRIIYLNRTVHGRKLVHLDENQLDGGNWAGWYWSATNEYDYEIECRDVDIIKTADTIKELCDGWVLESEAYTSGFFVIYNTKDNNQIMKNVKPFEYEKLFAFIKTDKGLIYVAKINDKGELELL